LISIIQETQPYELYNLAAESHVKVSFETPEYTANSDALGTLRLLEAIRILGLEKKTRFYQASTSEMYGLVQETPQKETTPFYPCLPMGWHSFKVIGSRSIIGRLMVFTPAKEFSSTMKSLYVEKRLLLVKSQWPWHGSPEDFKNVSIWGTWMPKEIGGMREIMWKECG